MQTWADLCILPCQTMSKWPLFKCKRNKPKVQVFSWRQAMFNISRITTKPTKWDVRPEKTQISLGIRPDWSASSLSAWRKLGSLATHWTQSEDSDQTGRMPRLIWVFDRRTCHFVGFVMRRLNFVFRLHYSKLTKQYEMPTSQLWLSISIQTCTESWYVFRLVQNLDFFRSFFLSFFLFLSLQQSMLFRISFEFIRCTPQVSNKQVILKWQMKTMISIWTKGQWPHIIATMFGKVRQ